MDHYLMKTEVSTLGRTQLGFYAAGHHAVDTGGRWKILKKMRGLHLCFFRVVSAEQCWFMGG